jgi:hypothetical protein
VLTYFYFREKYKSIILTRGVNFLQNSLDSDFPLSLVFQYRDFRSFDTSVPTWLDVPVYDAVVVAMLHTLQDLADALGGVGLGVELTRHDVLEQLAAGDEVEDQVVKVLLLFEEPLQ